MPEKLTRLFAIYNPLTNGFHEKFSPQQNPPDFITCQTLLSWISGFTVLGIYGVSASASKKANDPAILSPDHVSQTVFHETVLLITPFPSKC